jgi:hypothetical protein
MLKLYLWKNSESTSDFTDRANVNMPESSNAHSGGIVVLAESEEDAVELVKPYTRRGMSHVDGKYVKNPPIDIRTCNWDMFSDDPLDTSPVEIPIDKRGVVIYASGDC